MAAAIYAYAFLFPEDGPRLGPFDPRFRSAADLYIWSLTAAFASHDGSEVVPRGGTFALPFGRITVAFDAAELRAGSRELQHFVPVAQLKVEGLAMHYRWPGIGAPLAAATTPIAGANDGGDMVAPRLRVPLTALLRIPHARHALVEGRAITDALEGAVARLDPEGRDPALRRMVLIGHSQGGLLVKMQSISSGDRIWNAVSRKPLDQLRLSDKTRNLFRRGLFVEPLPEVARVVFISTPHRGSFV